MIIISYRYKKWPPILLLIPNIFLKPVLKDKELYHALVKELPRGLLADINVDNKSIKIRRI